ncbi:SDR family oxidoreductase [Pendulispora rubella]|uniref:SDR family oxidoreductase n=1 Tax=Pendulispora rubella TaxID=2741070 RepID=A0ABZ2L6A6_9BACT
MILVTGATGTIGRALMNELRAARVPRRAMVRDVGKAKSLLGGDEDLVQGDFSDAASLAAAVDGVDAVFLVTAAGPALAEHDLAMVRAVQGTRVKKLVKLSSFGVDTPGLNALKSSEWHRPGEQAVMQSGLAWTVLRPGAFASNALGWAPQIRASAPIQVATGEGKHAVIDPRDIAAVAVRALTESAHDGKAYSLSGPEALSTPRQVAILGEVLGLPIAIEDVSPQVAADRLRAAGVPEAYAAAVFEGYTWWREGKVASRSDDVAHVLGREPRSFEAWARDHAAAFRSD